MNVFMLPQTRLDKWYAYVHYSDFFSPDECARIIASGGDAPFEDAKINTAGTSEPSLRKSKVRWLSPNDANQWIFDKLSQACQACTSTFYPFVLSGFEEPLQLARYDAGGHYEMHRDLGDGFMSTRKLSFTVTLSPKEDFTGGEFEMLALAGRDKRVPQAVQGNLIAFPSYEHHRVAEVARGVRYSLTAWVHGPLFR